MRMPSGYSKDTDGNVKLCSVSPLGLFLTSGKEGPKDPSIQNANW